MQTDEDARIALNYIFISRLKLDAAAGGQLAAEGFFRATVSNCIRCRSLCANLRSHKALTPSVAPLGNPMRNSFSTLACVLACALATQLFAAVPPAVNDQKSAVKAWDKAAAARYLDDREVWWQEWPHAQKDHGTVCVSCH